MNKRYYLMMGSDGYTHVSKDEEMFFPYCLQPTVRASDAAPEKDFTCPYCGPALREEWNFKLDQLGEEGIKKATFHWEALTGEETKVKITEVRDRQLDPWYLAEVEAGGIQTRFFHTRRRFVTHLILGKGWMEAE